MVDSEPVSYEFPPIKEPADMWAFVETFAVGRGVFIEAQLENGERTLFPGVILPDHPIVEESQVSAHFATACEMGKPPWLLCVLTLSGGGEYRFRMGAEEHGWGVRLLECSVFLIVRDANDTRAFGVPCLRKEGDERVKQAIMAFEATACAWLKHQGTHPPSDESGGSTVESIVTDESGVAAFREQFPIYPIGGSKIALQKDGASIDAPTVFVPEGRPLPPLAADVNITTMLFLCLDGTSEPILGYKIEIEGEPEPFCFGVRARKIGWVVEAATLGFIVVQPEAVLLGKRERKLPLHEVRDCVTLAVPEPGTHTANDKVLSLFLKFGTAWVARQQRSN